MGTNASKQAEVYGVDIEKLTSSIIGNLVGFAEDVGGINKITFGAFVGAMAGGYEDVGVDLDMRFVTSMIAAWCGFARLDVPGWCVGDGVKSSVRQGRMFRELADAIYAELRKLGKSIDDVTVSAQCVKGASA